MKIPPRRVKCRHRQDVSTVKAIIDSHPRDMDIFAPWRADLDKLGKWLRKLSRDPAAEAWVEKVTMDTICNAAGWRGESFGRQS